MKIIIPLLILVFVAACNDETTTTAASKATVGIAVPSKIAAVPSN